jgi:uncharacterized protein (TIGR02300 family)
MMMPKAEWGVKRTCASCGARFYDLTKDPIVCPDCGATFVIETLSKGRGRRMVETTRETEIETEDADLVDDDDAVLADDSDDDDDDDVVVEGAAGGDGDDDADEALEPDDSVLLEDEDDDDDLGEFGEQRDDDDRR